MSHARMLENLKWGEKIIVIDPDTKSIVATLKKDGNYYAVITNEIINFYRVAHWAASAASSNVRQPQKSVWVILKEDQQ